MAKGTPKSGGLAKTRGGAKTPTADLKRLTAEEDQCPSFSFRFADKSHKGSWKWMTEVESHEVMEFLCDIGSSTWNEIRSQTTGGRDRHRKHHHQEMGSLCKEAQDRLAALKHDELFEDIFRFRLSGRKRLWGFLLSGVFYVLWWDAEHQVYPTERG